MEKTPEEYAGAERLKKYWAFGEGKKAWIGAAHPWAALNNALKRHKVPAHMVDGLTSNIFKLATGHAPSERAPGQRL